MPQLDRQLKIWYPVVVDGNVTYVDDAENTQLIWGALEDNGSFASGSDGSFTTYSLIATIRWESRIANAFIQTMQVEIIGEPTAQLRSTFNPEGRWQIGDRRLPISGDRKRFISLVLERLSYPLTGV